MNAALVAAMLVLGTALVAGSAQAGPIASVDCGWRPEHKVEVGTQDDPTVEVGGIKVYAPYVTSACPMT